MSEIYFSVTKEFDVLSSDSDVIFKDDVRGEISRFVYQHFDIFTQEIAPDRKLRLVVRLETVEESNE